MAVKVYRAGDNAAVIVLESKDDVEVLATMLANDVIGCAGRGETGLVASLSSGEGIAPDDPYYGSDEFTMSDASNLAADILEGLGGHDEAVTTMREALVWNTPTDED